MAGQPTTLCHREDHCQGTCMRLRCCEVFFKQVAYETIEGAKSLWLFWSCKSVARAFGRLLKHDNYAALTEDFKDPEGRSNAQHGARCSVPGTRKRTFLKS